MKLSDNRSRNVISLVALIPLFLFLLLSYMWFRTGQQRGWHRQCVDFWQKQQWHELTAMEENLWQLGQPNVEVMFLSVMASHQLGDAINLNRSAERLVQQHFLNYRMEQQMTGVFQANSLRQKIALYRSRGVLLLWSGLILLNVLSVVRKYNFFVLAGGLSIAGCILLLL